MEEFFQINALSTLFPRASWERCPSTVEANTGLILAALARHDVHATFFCLGWVARRHPTLIRRIHQGGHEIACHGNDHQTIFSQTPDDFRADVSTAKARLEDLTGEEVWGYRAPTYSVTSNTLWALDILDDLGFRYDSSIFPIHHDTYGMPDAPRDPYRHPRGLVEFPPATIRLGAINLPVAGGGYFRLLPYPLTRLALKTLDHSRHNFIFYLHPWEFNPASPRFKGLPLRTQVRTYMGLAHTERRFLRLIEDFKFGTARKVLQDLNLF